MACFRPLSFYSGMESIHTTVCNAAANAATATTARFLCSVSSLVWKTWHNLPHWSSSCFINLFVYSLYCIKTFIWNILECSFLCVQFDLLSQKHLLLPSSVSVSQLLTEHNNLTAAAAVAAISHRSVQWVAPQLIMKSLMIL